MTCEPGQCLTAEARGSIYECQGKCAYKEAEMTDTTEVKLHQTMDASVWADEFCKRFPNVNSHEGVLTAEDTKGLMLSWFANALMVGHDFAARTK